MELTQMENQRAESEYRKKNPVLVRNYWKKNSAKASTKIRVTGLWKENASQYRLLSTLRFSRSDTNVCLPEKSRNPTPWRFSSESTMRFTVGLAKSAGRTKYATIIAVKSLI